MSALIITMYRLNDGVTLEEFASFSRERDQPACRAKPACLKFDVYFGVEGTEGADRMVIEQVQATGRLGRSGMRQRRRPSTNR